jgi:hypothetical protein
MRKTHDVNLCCFYSLRRHLDTELFNANLVYHVGTAKGIAVDRQHGVYHISL